MTTQDATPEQYFFSRSRKRSRPNFKKMISEAVDIEIMEERNEEKRWQRLQAYKDWLQKRSWDEPKIKMGS